MDKLEVDVLNDLNMMLDAMLNYKGINPKDYDSVDKINRQLGMIVDKYEEKPKF